MLSKANMINEAVPHLIEFRSLYGEAKGDPSDQELLQQADAVERKIQTVM